MTDEFIGALGAALGADVVFGDAIAPRFHADWSGLDPVRPLALARPRSTEGVAAVLKICNQYEVPVVPQGGLTGLAGGAQPVSDGVALSLDRMSGIEEIDAVMATMTVLAGTPLATIQAAADEVGLFFGLDLGARDSCTIGGNLATNAGGNRVIRYGMAREHVLGIEVVLADGTIVRSLNKMLKNNAGYDLKQLFIGSEGTLGVVTRAVLRLQAKPGAMASAFCGCRDFDAVLGLLKAARARLGSSLTSFEVMWPSFYDFMTAGLPHLRRPFAAPHGCYVLIEASGLDAEQNNDLLQSVLADCLEEGCVSDAVVAVSDQDSKDLWAVRESVSEYGRLMGPLTAFDLGLPTSEMGAFVTAIEDAFKRRWPDAIVLCYGHVGDSNLHLVSNIPSEGDHQPHDEIAELVYGAVGRAGGTISAEHGIGLLKKPYLGYSRSVEELALMNRIKLALDPNNILNTGKVLTLREA
ncbi:FAD-binding oxidoreductase [Microvirga antarctica]|uniref:FAD-binding oxidoreductase n=1 Tax=Microvirga antarctica TaxID=2819233 RepID=UPI001B306D31|nr:FAD-binding oxidoreductase [Microvirga antarctica]